MKKSKYRSLKIILSFYSILIMLLLITATSLISFYFTHKALEELYLSNLMNVNKTVSLEVETFLDLQLKGTQELAALQIVKEVALSGTSTPLAEELITNKFNTFDNYEEVFISTAGEDPQIIVSGNGKQAGLHWGGGIGFDENIEKNLQGMAFVSSPMKSPSGESVVSLVSAPIMQDGKVIGIVGLPLDLGTFSQMVLKDVAIGKTGYPYLSDKEGVVFAHPNPAHIFTLNFMEHDWAEPLLSMPSNSDITYVFEKKLKYAHKIVSEKYDIIYFSSGYASDVNDDTFKMVMASGTLAFIIIIIAALIMYFVIKKRLVPLERAKELADELASGDGDLTKRIEINSEDEIGVMAHSFNVFIQNTHDLILQIKNGTHSLVEAIQEIASGNENLSQRTSEQASSLEEIASTIEETTATITQNAENSTRTRGLTDETLGLAKDGTQVVKEAVSAIDELSSSSNKISEIITVINEIAF